MITSQAVSQAPVAPPEDAAEVAPPDLLQHLRDAFPDALDVSVSADGIPSVRVRVEAIPEAVRRVRAELKHGRFVDVTCLDLLATEERFELVYLFYAMDGHTWLRLRARTDAEAPSITPQLRGAAWYEREVYDLFGVRFAGHPDLTRIMMPDDWAGHPLRRDQPLGQEPVDFTVTRRVYGDD